MDLADGVLWPLATDPDRPRWAAQACELYLHLARLIIARAAAWPGAGHPLAAEALAHVEPLYEAIARRVDALGRLPTSTA
jgi:hypothetical protein